MNRADDMSDLKTVVAGAGRSLVEKAIGRGLSRLLDRAGLGLRIVSAAPPDPQPPPLAPPPVEDSRTPAAPPAAPAAAALPPLQELVVLATLVLGCRALGQPPQGEAEAPPEVAPEPPAEPAAVPTHWLERTAAQSLEPDPALGVLRVATGAALPRPDRRRRRFTFRY